jgi:hypothetical protein
MWRQRIKRVVAMPADVNVQRRDPRGADVDADLSSHAFDEDAITGPALTGAGKH